jgi:hypothetical protein
MKLIVCLISDFYEAEERTSWEGEISGSHGDEYEDDCLMGCCAV